MTWVKIVEVHKIDAYYGCSSLKEKIGKRYSGSGLTVSEELGMPWMRGRIGGILFRAVKVEIWEGK